MHACMCPCLPYTSGSTPLGGVPGKLFFLRTAFWIVCWIVLFCFGLDCFVFVSFRCWFASLIIREAEQTKRTWAVTTRSSNKVHLFMVINVYKNSCHIYFSHPLQQIARFSLTRSWKMKMCEHFLQSISSYVYTAYKQPSLHPVHNNKIV